MRKPYKTIAIFCLSFLLSQNASALNPATNSDPEKAALEQIVIACNATLVGCQDYSTALKETNGTQSKIIDAQQKRLADLESKQESILNSKTLWFLLGIIGGGVAFRTLSK